MNLAISTKELRNLLEDLNDEILIAELNGESTDDTSEFLIPLIKRGNTMRLSQ